LVLLEGEFKWNHQKKAVIKAVSNLDKFILNQSAATTNFTVSDNQFCKKPVRFTFLFLTTL
jgi:hypothetical protein